jgi:hypothetical protein
MERMSKAIAVSLVLFAIVFAAFAGSRVDQVTIALLGGALIGLLVAVPLTLLTMAIVLRRRDERVDSPQPTVHVPPVPQAHWPPPNHPAQFSAQPWPLISAPAEFNLPPPRRRFYVIGESGEVRELTDATIDGEVVEDSRRDARL